MKKQTLAERHKMALAYLATKTLSEDAARRVASARADQSGAAVMLLERIAFPLAERDIHAAVQALSGVRGDTMTKIRKALPTMTASNALGVWAMCQQLAETFDITLPEAEAEPEAAPQADYASLAAYFTMPKR